jgi:hypothetical protein
MSKKETQLLKRKKSTHVPDTSHRTVKRKKTTKKIPEVFYVFQLLKISLRVTIHKVSDGGLEVENTKQC